MKKLFTMLITLGLIINFGNYIYADNSIMESTPGSSEVGTSLPENQQLGVFGAYAGATPATRYSLELKWDELYFRYEVNGEKEWDPNTHTYTISNEERWNPSSSKVTVTNHSNADVNVSFSFAKNESITGNYTGNMSVSSKRLAAGVENKVDEADSIDSSLTLSGALGVEQYNPEIIGTITVSLSPVE